MRTELRIKRSGRKNRIDHSQVIKDFEGARLDAFAARSLEGRRGGLDQAKRDAAARKIDGERQPGWSGSDNQNIAFVHRTMKVNGTVYECQEKNPA